MLQIMIEKVTFGQGGQDHFQTKQTQNKTPMNPINTPLEKQCFDLYTVNVLYLACMIFGVLGIFYYLARI